MGMDSYSWGRKPKPARWPTGYVGIRNAEIVSRDDERGLLRVKVDEVLATIHPDDIHGASGIHAPGDKGVLVVCACVAHRKGWSYKKNY